MASYSQMIEAVEERVSKLEEEIKKIYELIRKGEEKEVYNAVRPRKT